MAFNTNFRRRGDAQGRMLQMRSGHAPILTGIANPACVKESGRIMFRLPVPSREAA